MSDTQAQGTDAERLAEARRRLLGKLLRGEVKPAPGGEITRAAGGPAYPMSAQQEQLWFLDQLQPGNPAYNLPSASLVSAGVDVLVLERALSEIVRRHQGLRTVFRMVDGEPMQIVQPRAPVRVEMDDLRGADGADAPLEQVRRAAAAWGALPFDLAAGPLFRCRLSRVSQAESLLAFNFHHIVADGWSLAVVMRELAELYDAFGRGEPSPLAEPAIQYADYAVWQRERLQGGVAQRQLAFWTEHLRGAPTVLELPCDRPRPPVLSGRGAVHRFVLPPTLVERLRALGAEEGASLNMVLLAGINLLLQRYAGQDDLVVGTVLANRNRAELEGMVGDLVNPGAVRTRLDGDPPFRRVLRQVRASVLEAEANQEVPFESVVDALRVPRDPSRNPLFQVMHIHHVRIHPRAERARTEHALQMRPLDPESGDSLVDAGAAKLDMVWSTVERDGGLGGMVEYSIDLLDEATVARMAAHLGAVLDAASARPDTPISRLPLLGDDERAALEAWNRTDAAYPADRCVHQLIQAQVERTPDAVALVFGDDALTYRELDAWANRLAHHLAGLGVGPEVRVALCLERSLEMVVAMLAVLKAGGAYVPLDPAYPAERLAYMLDDSGARVLVTHEAARGVVPAGRARVVLIDAAEIAAAPADAPRTCVGAENAAYVIYTSGSTGRPKGVQVTHRNVSSFFTGMDERVGGTIPGTWLAVTRISFDIHVLELLWTLARGFRVVVQPDLAGSPRGDVAEQIRRHAVTHLQCTPSLAAMLVAESGVEALSGLQRVLLGGEALPPALAARVASAVPGGLVNVYGPTETTVWSTTHAVARVAGAVVPIGRPIANTRVHVLDAAGQPAPLGVPGELCIGGAGVARGYLHRPGLTAERFVPDPFASAPGARMYRTGDRVRWREESAGVRECVSAEVSPDSRTDALPHSRTGVLEYLGRLDEQVKIHGVRIETGEVEAALRGCEGVAACAVAARDDGSGDRRLVAYVVPSGPRAPDAETLRAQLRQSLPDSMVPAVYVTLDALPLTPNGKLDRRALPAPDLVSVEERHVAPRTPVEEVLAGIWAEVLGAERVGVHDDFFALGGHSLLGTRVASRVREAFGVELPLRALFDGPSVAQLARVVEEMRRAGLPALPPVVPVDRAAALPLSFAQERLWFLDRLEPGRAFYNIPFALRLSGAVDEAALERALGEIVRRHQALRTTFREVDGVPVQVIAPFTGFALPVEDLSGRDPAEREAAARSRVAEEAARPFDLSTGPLIRPALLRLDAEESVLLLCMHHVVSDGWSLGVLAGELSALYAAYRDGAESSLPDLVVQYADYAAWQREQLKGEMLDRQLAWWKERLAGAPALLEIPTDRPRPAMQTYRGAEERIELSAGLLERLEALGRREGATLYMVLLGAFQVLLARHGAGDDVVVGSPIAGRTRRELEGLIGFFVNTLVLRTDLSGDPSFRGVLRRVRDATLGAYEHQEVPFEKLVAELQPERSLSHSPLFQAMFSLERAGPPRQDPPGLRMRGEPAPLGVTKFDLSLTLAAHQGRLAGALEYATDLFEPATIRRMLRHLERVLEQVAVDPDLHLSELDLLGDSERARLLESWRGTEAGAAADRCIHHLFAEQAERTPDAVAAVFEGDSISYGELDARANRLAHRLRRLGVGTECRVGVMLERGLDLPVALLGVLKAGGAYVPLDPSYPAERIAWLMEDSAVSVVITRGELAAGLFASGARVLRLDADADALAREPGDAPAVRVPAEAAAYVIYTSGSTGTPRGVVVSHGAAAAHLAASAAAYGLRPGDRVLAFAAISFDASVEQVLAPLVAGAAVVLRGGELWSPDALADAIERLGVSVIDPPTAYWHALAGDAAGLAAVRERVRLVVVGGEALRPESVAAWHRAPGAAALCNVYGPTEGVVTATLHRTRAEDGEAARVPVGRALDGRVARVLDARMRPIAEGVPGELFLGGPALAREYQGRPARTAERFVPDPYSAIPGARLYRTGDRVRWVEPTHALTHSRTHALDFLGRLDEQVKVRGFRIEPGEIEAALRRHPGVADCAVVAREDGSAERRLVAYVVGDADADALRAHLRRSLPEYMVPGAFVALQAIPLLASGKVDRRALPAPEASAAERYAPPRTPAEAVLAGVWAEVLRLERVGVNENFFALGGDSILSIQVVSRARRAGVEITPRQMFEYQTIAELAAVAGGVAQAGVGTAEEDGDGGSVRLTPVQRWFFEQELAAPWHYNQSALLEVDAAVSDGALEAALAAVARHHDALRQRFRRTDGGWEPWHAADAGIALERIDLSGLAADAQDRAQAEVAARAQATLDLEQGPLGRAVLFDRGERGRVLLLVFHHLVIDGVSWRILRDDLERACEQVGGGVSIDLGAKGTSYRRWAEVLQAYAGSPALREEADYWLAQGPEGVAPLPIDGDGGPAAASAATVVVRLEAEETRALLQEVPAAYRTQINDVLLCALAEVVGAWTGGPRVRITLEGHGREEEVGAGVDLTRTMGWFTSLYPVVLDLPRGAGPGERLTAVKERLRAVPGRGMGYGVLRYLSPDQALRGALAAQAEPQISFNYLGQFDQGREPSSRLRLAAGARGHDVAEGNPRRHLLEVDGGIAAGRLQLVWSYGEGTHRRETIEWLAGAYLDALRALIAHCRQADAGGCTPSDFPLAALAQPELDAAVGRGRGVEDLYPLSPAQEGILFHALYGGGTQAYQVQVAMRLEGALDADLLRRAWVEVVSRHAILRTSFVWQGLQRPLQRVEAAVEVPWRLEDWTDRTDAAQEAALERFLAADSARGFVLDRAPLLRCALFRVANDAHWLVWSQHHLLLDGWSSARVLDEVFRLYRAWSAGESVELKRVRPYRDYIAWLGRRDPDAARAYWSAVLAGCTAPTPLGVDRAPGPGAGEYAKRARMIPAESTRRLEEAARRRQVTLNTLLQGAWALLLSRYSGEEDVVFGTTVSGRPAELEGVEEMVGLFINTLPARARVPRQARLDAWLGELQRAQAGARDHEHAPLADVQGWSQVPRGTPLFESLFVFENYPVERSGRAPGSLRLTKAHAVEWTNYPLTLMVAPGTELHLAVSYDQGRLDADAIERMLGHLERVLDRMAGDADVRLDEIGLLDDAERRLVVEEWGRMDSAEPADRCTHRLIEEQAERTPDAAAVVFDDAPLTYRELNEAANRLAHRLLRLGVGPDVRVGICMERGPGMIISVLAVLKAGGACVPLDPAYPAERLALMLADAAMPVLLTKEKVRDGLPGLVDIRVISVDGEWPEIADEPAENPASRATLENLAYVLYTSGSTGTPKGVMQTHAMLSNLVAWHQDGGVAPGSLRTLQFASLSFDVSFQEIAVTLASGGALVLVDDDLRRDPERLVDFLDRAGVERLFLPFVALQAIAEAAHGRALPLSLREVITAGEQLVSTPQIAALIGNIPGCLLINHYGPTETHVATAHTLAADPSAWSTLPPIGRPVASTRTYVLDGAMRPVPVGVPGELYVGGVQVARGYLDRPALTAQRFIPDPISGEPGARLYATGDRARWREIPGESEAGRATREHSRTDALTHSRTRGELEYLGRADQQVKIRGFRVEPGEIEAALRRHTDVADCAVVAREDGSGERRLVAYVVGDADAEVLRADLRRSLPEHMVPAAFVALDALPLTPSGKLDRRALPAPGLAPGGAHAAPRTPVEEVLAGIWAEVLHVERVGADDNFFALGGHSLLATRVISRIREALGAELPLRALFERPTVAELARAVEEVRRAGLPVPPPVIPVGRDRTLPLSFAQERLWFLERLWPGSAIYNIPVTLRLDGALDEAALERALGEIIRRHEALRTTFADADGVAAQVIAPFSGFSLPIEDFSGLSEAEREMEARRLASAEAVLPFNLSSGPLFRAKLLRLGIEEHVLLLCMHHMVSDGWSLGVLFRELSALYAAFREAGESPLPELAVQYADFAVWQREQLRGEVLDRQLAYWKDRLAGAPALLDLPTDHPRPATPTYRGAHEPIDLPGELLERLEALGRREGATLYMVLLAAFQVLLSKYSGSEDVVVGSPIAGRTRREVEALIGFFVNTLVLRTDLSGDPRFRETLRRVRETTLGAYEHQDVPFEKLVEELQPERSLSHAPLFQVMFTLQNNDGSAEALPGVRARGVEVEFDSTRFDLSLTLAAHAGRLGGILEYSTDLFERRTIRRMLGHLERVLEQVVGDAELRLSQLDLLDAAERSRVIEEWNQTDAAYPAERCIHHLIEEQAARTPDATAVVFDDTSLTYRQLDQRANRLANHLVRLGVGPEVRVGVCLERSLEMVVSILAVLKAGGAYVPLDPGYPAERLAFMLADSGVGVLLTQERLRDALATADGVAIVIVDAENEIPESAERPTVAVTPGNLAYVIYTSGSTGRPKGVMNAHRGVVNRLCWMQAEYGIDSTDVILQKTPFSFDVSVWEFFWPLQRGARLVMARPDGHRDPAYLQEVIERCGVTTLHFVPSMLQPFIESADPARCASLTRVICSGEALSPALVERFHERFPSSVSLHNLYGPTEAAVDVSHWPCARTDAAGVVPIGRPVWNTRLYVLDAALGPVPVGVPGELYIGGVQVARGYLGRPALTAERFVPDPFGAPGSRLYRTGDRARWVETVRECVRADVLETPDTPALTHFRTHALQYLGRLDEQVKIRGFRIELGEIEAALRRHPGVADCVAVVRDDVPGDPRLAAYVVGDADAESLRAHLRRSLPEYMVPAAFATLDALPLTPSGKLDRRALPAPELASADAYVAPRTPVEEMLGGIWAEVLRLERVGIGESFFDLGGHSLLATRVVSRIRDVFGVEVPLRTIFEAPTVENLAEAVEEARRTTLPPLPPIIPVSRDRTLPLSFAQERLWFLDRLEPESPFYNLPAALRLEGALDVAALERALGEIIRRHQALRTTFVDADGAPVQVIAPFAGFELAVEDLSGAGEEAARRLTSAEAARPFDLAAGPLFRAKLLRLGIEEHVLVLCMHHVVSDGWSLGVLFRELSALYAAFREGGESPLPELAVQYADFAVWQREQLRGEVLDRQLAYWKDRLAAAPALLELPTDHPRPATPSYRGAYEPVELSTGLRERLEALARREGATLYMVLLAAFQVLLSKYSGMEDVVVGSPIAGRTRREVEALIGFFVNTLVLRSDLSGDPTFRETLQRVRETTLGAYEHQEVPFEKLVEELQPERSLSHAPLFQVMFALQNTDGSAEALPGVRARGVEVEFDSTKFDLSLILAAHAGGLGGGLEYSTDLFERGTIRRMLGHLERVMEQVAADAELRLSELDLLDAAERALVVEEWNRTDTAYPAERCIHHLFQEQAARTPDATAVVFGDASLTYRELDGRANRLANHLVRLGVGPEVRVGICLERGLEMVISILAVLKAGGAYVPLDPGYPVERLSFMLADSAAPVLVTQDDLRGLLPPRDGTVVVSVDSDAARIAAESAESPESGATPGALAYVIYTSGSTGTPKGALVEHRNVARLFSATDAWFRFGERDVWTLFHSYAFDFSVWEMWGALLYGGRVIVVPLDVSRDPEAFHALVRREGVTVLSQTPSAFRQLMRVDAERGGELALRVVVFGGEALEPATLGDWAARRGVEQPRLVNMYGITETTVHVTYRPLAREDVFAGAGSPIGVRIPDLRLYVLEPAMRPSPLGVPGELYVGGGGVARGYLGRPALTAQRFVPDPFAGDAGARLYRTGDRARWRADGQLEYLGRADQQVKIRGFRIEPAEIEAALRRHPGVADCVVVAREDVPGDRRLAAYVVGDADAEVLRAELRQSLPEYMVPAAFVALECIPLTPNGKVDRKALPAPEPASADAYVAPRTPVEEVLTGIWAEVLRIERVGIGESFFELGGHSLLATRVISRIREVFGAEVPLRALFESPTVAGLGEVIEEVRRAGLPVPPPVVPVARDQALPLSFAQERLWFLDRMQPDNPFYNVAAAFRMEGVLDAAALERALGEIVRRHEALRTKFAEADGVPAQVIAPFAGFVFPVEDLTGFSEPEREALVRRRAADDAARPFDLAAGPLFRATLLRLDAGEHVLLLCMHHVVSDGWSLGVLFRELSALYTAYREGGESPLPELAVQYADFAVWQREQLRGEVLDRQLAWWKERLAGAPALLELPTDHPRPAVQAYRGAYEPVELSAGLRERLEALGRRDGATLYMVLLAAFQVLLSKYSGSEDVVVGSPIAGRTRREVEALIGFFVNTLVLRTDLSGDPSFRALLRRVRETTLGAYAHQDVPFEKLVEEVRPERSLSHSPLFQVMLTLQNTDASGGVLPGLRIRGVETDSETVKYDLSLTLAAHPGGLGGGLEYSTDLFERGTILRMMGHLERVLEQVADDAELRLSELDLLDAAERSLVVDEWNRTEAELPSALVHELFSRQAARTPEAEALRCGGRGMTYRALDEASNRLAHHLAARGVGAESIVGIVAERAPETVVAILAVLKAGGAYLPLDPAYPADRLRFMLADAGARTIIAPAGISESLSGLSLSGLAEDVLDPRAEAAEIAAHPLHPPCVAAHADDLAYVIYTSGSTGLPKGVMVSHRGVPNLAYAQIERFGIDSSSRILQFASFSFDAAVSEVFTALLAGATLVMASREELLPGAGLMDTLRRERISVATLPPSVLAVLPDDDLPDLRTLVSAGEAADAALVERWSAGRRFINAYGPTETTVCPCCAVCGPDGRTPSIGQPLDNVRLYVLDAGGRPTPVGVPGELFVGGVGVARGYLGRPALTAERFVPDPFGAAGGRLYRTGDRVRWVERTDALTHSRTHALDFLGRVDAQVKVRGFRIEPGEIEAALRRHPGVTGCAVVAREDVAGDRRLVAYVTGDAEPDDLRAHLRRSLPDYMVPGPFVVLDALPLTGSGKVDRNALPAPERAGGAASPRPRDEMEETVAEAWRSVLGPVEIGVHDSFFDLGGSSLLLYRVYTRLREIRGDLRVVDLFQFTTVEALARHLGAAGQGDGQLAQSRSRAGDRGAARRRIRGG